MASCPCGCGRNLGFMKRRTALHACDLAVTFPVLEHAIDMMRTDGEPTHEVAAFLNEGQGMADEMLAHVHGKPAWETNPPSLNQLQGWQQMCRTMCRGVRELDQQWWNAYVGTLSPDGQRLMNSM